MDDSRTRSKTAPFSFENGLVWTGPIVVATKIFGFLQGINSEYHGSLQINYNVILSNFRSIICQVFSYGRLKTKENFKLLVSKVVAVTYEKWSLTRGSNYRDLT